MDSTQRAARISVVLAWLALGCDTKDTQVLTDTSAAGSAGGGSAGAEQLEAAPGRIQQALRADTALRSFQLEAKKTGDHVVLEGSVRTAQQKELAAQIAEQNAGGIRVDNRIRIEGR